MSHDLPDSMSSLLPTEALAHTCGLGTEKCFDVSGFGGQGIHFSAALRAKDGSQIHPWLCGGGLVILWLSTKDPSAHIIASR